MKKQQLLILALSLVLAITACGTFSGGEADQITVPMENRNASPEPKVGDVLQIEYDGSIAESYPAQITNVYSISVVE